MKPRPNMPTALIVSDRTCAASAVKPLLADLPADSAHISVLVVGETEPLPAYAYGAEPYGPVIIPKDWSEHYEQAGAETAERANEIESLLQAEGLEGDVTASYAEPALVSDIVASRAALSDIAFLHRSEAGQTTEQFNRLLAALLFDAPVGVVVNAASVALVPSARRPLVAWDSSPQAVRAVHRALPILAQADEVTVVVFDGASRDDRAAGSDPGVDLATWLSRHGCTVALQQCATAGQSVAEALLSKAADTDADLLVMGGYGHSRLRQRLFGGTTKSILEQSKYPVMLAH